MRSGMNRLCAVEAGTGRELRRAGNPPGSAVLGAIDVRVGLVVSGDGGAPRGGSSSASGGAESAAAAENDAGVWTSVGAARAAVAARPGTNECRAITLPKARAPQNATADNARTNLRRRHTAESSDSAGSSSTLSAVRGAREWKSVPARFAGSIRGGCHSGTVGISSRCVSRRAPSEPDEPPAPSASARRRRLRGGEGCDERAFDMNDAAVRRRAAASHGRCLSVVRGAKRAEL